MYRTVDYVKKTACELAGYRFLFKKPIVLSTENCVANASHKPTPIVTIHHGFHIPSPSSSCSACAVLRYLFIQIEYRNYITKWCLSFYCIKKASSLGPRVLWDHAQ